MSERKFASTSIRDSEDKLGLTPEGVNQLLAENNTTVAITKGFTKMGDVNIPDGLIFTSLIKLLDAGNDGDEMAGVSGIAGDNKEDPAFWAGGSYDQAIGGTAKAIIRHDGSSKFTDTEITGTVNATEGTIGSMKLQNNMLVSDGEKLIIDGTSSTITLKDASSDDVKILIKPNNLPTSPSSFFGSSTKQASFTAIKSTITSDGSTLSSNTIAVGANESYTFNIPEVTLTASVLVPWRNPGDPQKVAAVATAELYLTDGSVRVYIGNEHAVSFSGLSEHSTTIPATTRTISSPGNWRLQLRLTLDRGGYNWGDVQGYAQLESSSSIYSATPIVNRSEFGANGLIVATSANEYAFMVGSTFEVKRQNHMLRVNSSDIQMSKNAGSKWTSLYSGVLGVVHFTLSDGITYQWTKDGSTISLSNTTSNPFRVNHNLGHTDYFAIPSASAKYGYLVPENRYANYCTFSKSEIDMGHRLSVLIVGKG